MGGRFAFGEETRVPFVVAAASRPLICDSSAVTGNVGVVVWRAGGWRGAHDEALDDRMRFIARSLPLSANFRAMNGVSMQTLPDAAL